MEQEERRSKEGRSKEIEGGLLSTFIFLYILLSSFIT